MYSVEIMVTEHENILKFIKVVRNACCSVLEGREIDIEDFQKMIMFARNYADDHHHGKEEQILFTEMTQNLGRIGDNLIRHGMLVEHDAGRLHISDLETSLNLYSQQPETIHKLGIIAGAAGYANLLERHILKENEVIYPYAEKKLSDEIWSSINERVKDFENIASQQNVQEDYLQLLKDLTEKYP